MKRICERSLTQVSAIGGQVAPGEYADSCGVPRQQGAKSNFCRFTQVP
jgi:hypothetical protein